MILLDTSGLLAWIDSGQRRHAAVAGAMEETDGPFLLSPFVLAEIEYLLATRVGAEAERALLGEVARGALRLEPFRAIDVEACLEVIERYPDLGVDLADASIVVLAARHGVRDLLTLDQRHFRVLTASEGAPFRLLPGDRSVPRP